MELKNNGNNIVKGKYFSVRAFVRNMIYNMITTNLGECNLTKCNGFRL